VGAAAIAANEELQNSKAAHRAAATHSPRIHHHHHHIPLFLEEKKINLKILRELVSLRRSSFPPPPLPL